MAFVSCVERESGEGKREETRIQGTKERARNERGVSKKRRAKVRERGREQSTEREKRIFCCCCALSFFFSDPETASPYLINSRSFDSAWLHLLEQGTSSLRMQSSSTSVIALSSNLLGLKNNFLAVSLSTFPALSVSLSLSFSLCLSLSLSLSRTPKIPKKRQNTKSGKRSDSTHQAKRGKQKTEGSTA